MAINAVGEYERQGKELLCVTGDFSAAGVLEIETGFAHIDGVSASLVADSATVTLSVTHDVSDNVVTLYAWKATAADNVALIASDAEDTVRVTIFGRRRQ